jgi:signal transduction histidine kinase
MNIIPYAEQICFVLDQLALPRAFVDSKLDRFVAWNSHFLNALNIPEDQIKSQVASEVLSFENGIEFNDGFRMVPCSAHLLAASKPPVNGHAIAIEGQLTFVMLDVGTSAGQASPRQLQGTIQEEQNQLYQFLHDRMSPRLMAMAFLTERLAAHLETAQPEAAEEAAKIRRLLGEVLDEMHLLFAPPGVPQGKRP